MRGDGWALVFASSFSSSVSLAFCIAISFDRNERLCSERRTDVKSGRGYDHVEQKDNAPFPS
jgi:hypothetical protein